MKSATRYLLTSACAWLLVFIESSAAVAANPLNYLNGPYLIWTSAETLNITFDGAGNYTGTASYTTGAEGILCSGIATSGTYTVAADGTISIIYTIYLSANGNTCPAYTYTGQIASGNLSPDGNTLVLNSLTSGQQPDELVGIKLGEIVNDNYGAGVMALNADTTGIGNTAAGDFALQANVSGSNNTAFGYNALFSNTAGKGNAAQGVNALYNNTSGIRNLAIGSNALYNNNGSYNVALGFDAGYNVTTGSNNIEIGTQGSANDNNTIQIGVQGTQTATTIAGIYGTQITGSAVYVTSTGQLGVQGSSERFKTDIAPMPYDTAKLAQLRPVTFHYKTDPSGIQQYGLIAEEVDKVYPELVIRDEKGVIQGVRYEELAPMLLNEMQKQQRINAQQAASIRAQATEISDLKQQVTKVNDLEHELADMRAALAALQTKDQIVARR